MNEERLKFQKLTPTTEVDLGIYENAMNYVFSNDDIRNIAISGSYGAGKSSMIETYKKNHSNMKFLHISLAHFEEEGTQNEIKGNLSESMLEGKILNQLIHQIDPENIPQTNFKVKKKFDSKQVLKCMTVIMLFVLLFCFISFNKSWNNMVNRITLNAMKWLLYFTTTSEAVLVSGVVCTGILCRAIFELLKAQKNRKIFKKINIKGNEIEIFEDTKDSYFDKYLNEVLYLFENTNADAIVFEDMDRYNTNLIFEKLREINTLLNRRKELFTDKDDEKNKKPMRFFYLLRDDIFVSKDRTKFFDFIIPIVPVIDASNAYDKFIEYFKEGSIFQIFDENFMQGLSLYVDDMRILKNIYNEFVIYHERFFTTSTEQNSNKLLAMITYKNIFPRDFGELQISQGYVHTLFEKKEDFRKKEISRLQKVIDALEIENKDLEAEICQEIDELDAIFFSTGQRVRVNDMEEIQFAKRSEFIKAIKKNPNQVYSYNGYYRNWNMLNTDQYFNAITKNPEYIKRKKKIEIISNGKIETNRSEISKLKQQQEDTKNYYLKDIINRKNSKEIFQVSYVNELNETNGFEEIKRSPYFPLIKYLTKNGYIDETYPDYMTYFYENSISRIDKIFLRSITDEEAKDYTYALDNPQLVISRMRDVDFEALESLNYELLDCLLKNSEIYKGQLHRFLHRLCVDKPIDFASGYLNRNIERKAFTREFNKIWQGVCEWILKNNEFSVQIRKNYIVDTLCVSSDEVIADVNKDNLMSEYICSDDNFLDILAPDVDKIFTGLKKLKIRFTSINYEKANKNLFEEVYNNNMYELNSNMIDMILEQVYKIEKSNEYKTKNLTLIFSNPNTPLSCYVKNNMEEYMETVLENVEGICDDEITALYIINCEDISEDSRSRYIDLLQTKIQYLDSVKDKTFWKKFISSNKVMYNQKNILDYYYISENGMDTYLISYINIFSDPLILETEGIDDNYGEKVKDNLFFSIMESNEIDNKKYKVMLKSFHLICSTFNEKGIDADKISILIKLGIIPMTAIDLEFMRTNYHDSLMEFIIRNIKKYVEVISAENFSSDELLEILDTDVNDEFKIELLKFENGEISIQKKDYSETVMEFILKNNFDKSDMSYLLNWYPAKMPIVQSAIITIAADNINNIISQEYKIKSDLFSKLMNINKITIDHKKSLMAVALPNMEESTAKNFLEMLDLKAYLNLFDGKRPKFEKTKSNKMLLTSFETRRWITSFEEDKNDSNYYKAYGRMKRKH